MSKPECFGIPIGKAFDKGCSRCNLIDQCLKSAEEKIKKHILNEKQELILTELTSEI